MPRLASYLKGVYILLALCLMGCATTNTLVEHKLTGKLDLHRETFPYPYYRVFEAAEETCRDLQLHVQNLDKDAGTIFALTKLSTSRGWTTTMLETQGCLMGIWITAKDKNSTLVEVGFQKKATFVQPGFTDYRPMVLNGIEDRLE